MNFKGPVYYIVFFSLFVLSNANCSADRTRRKAAIEEIPRPADRDDITAFNGFEKAVGARDKRDYYPYGEYSDTTVNGNEYEAENGMEAIDYYETDIQENPLDKDTFDNYGDLDEEDIDYDGEDYYGYYEGEADEYEEDLDNTDYEYNASDWDGTDTYNEMDYEDYGRREIEYDEYESDEGQTAEDMELWFRKRRAAEDEALVCDTDKERELVRRISSLRETLTVMQKELDYEQNKCQSSSVSQSVTNPTASTMDKTHRKQHKKVDDLPVCEI